MTTGFLLNSKASIVLLNCLFLSVLPGTFSSGVVTLKSIEIFTTHEWFKAKPTVYFLCKGENKTTLPDVKEAHFLYTFKGEESWQPLTEFADTKCKRCGLYEHDTIGSDDVFEEWEFCPSDFAGDGKFTRVKDKEFNATFLCPKCLPSESVSNHTSDTHSRADNGKRMNVFLVIMIAVLVSTVFLVGSVAAYKYWLRKKREHDQARFLKLFEDGDDIEDELGLGNMV